MLSTDVNDSSLLQAKEFCHGPGFSAQEDLHPISHVPRSQARPIGQTNQPASGKVIISRGDAETNSFWASLQDSNAAVIITRKANLSWYYLTDASGQLRRAIVNDANIYHGGGTNLSLGKESERFETQKRKWLGLYGR